MFARLARRSAAGLAAAMITAAAHAAPVLFNNSLVAGINQFDTSITGVGGTVQTQQVIFNQTTYAAFDVTRPLGGTPSTVASYSSGLVSLTGAAFSINPGASGSDPIPGFNSGIKFTFANPINAFGFEIGDWATCCHTGTRPLAIQTTYGVPAQGSGLWIAFDGGSANLTANALNSSGNPGYVATNSYTNFIGAIDTSNTFSSVTFFGDGFGEYLVAGGTIRFANLDIGTEVPPPPVPLPAGLALMLGGLGMLGAFARARKR